LFQYFNEGLVIYYLSELMKFLTWVRICLAVSRYIFASSIVGLPSGSNPNDPGYLDSIYKLSKAAMISSSILISI